MQPSNERRRYVRVDQSALVSFEKLGEQTGGKLAGVLDAGIARTIDMSVEGLLVEFPRPVTPGDHLRLDLLLEGDIIQVEGVVVRIEQHDGVPYAGIRLTKVPAQYVGSIHRFEKP